jgi:hypothetical protein
MHHFRIPDVTLQAGCTEFFLWWQQTIDRMSTNVKAAFNTLVALGTWLWKIRNDVVFNGATPRIDRALLAALEEAEYWMLAGAKDLSAVVANILSELFGLLVCWSWHWYLLARVLLVRLRPEAREKCWMRACVFWPNSPFLTQ